MDNKDKRILNKIIEHITSVIDYCAGCENLKDFQNDPMRVEACVFNLMQIGELAKNSLSDDAKNKITAIPWKQIYGMRNRIVHGYSGVDMKIVWDTINVDLPKLRQQLINIL